MEGTLAIAGFWLFMIVLVFKKPLTALMDRSKPTIDKQTDQKLQSHELLLQAIAKDLGEIKLLLQAQSTGNDLIQLKSSLKEVGAGSNESNDEQDDNADEDGSEDSRSDDRDSASEGEKDDDEDESKRDDLGSLVDANTIRFERVLPGSVEQVWKYISEPELLQQWLCTSATLTPRDGARVQFEFEDDHVADFIGCARIRGLVSDASQPARLCHSWIDSTSVFESEVEYEVEQLDGNETKLTVTHKRIPSGKMAEYLASWHVWLDNLMRRLRDLRPLEFSTTSKRLLPIYSAIVLAAVISSGPAQARLSDHDYQTVRAERAVLLDKFDTHWHTADSLEREISELKRDNTAASDDQTNQLSKRLDDEHRDLRKLELDIRDLDKVLI